VALVSEIGLGMVFIDGIVHVILPGKISKKKIRKNDGKEF